MKKFWNKIINALKSIKEEKHIVYVPKVGTHIDSNAFGGHYITKDEQEKLIENEKESWRHTITCRKQISSVLSSADEETPYLHMKYVYTDNPYFGWKESQLKIVIR